MTKHDRRILSRKRRYWKKRGVFYNREGRGSGRPLLSRLSNNRPVARITLAYSQGEQPIKEESYTVGVDRVRIRTQAPGSWLDRARIWLHNIRVLWGIIGRFTRSLQKEAYQR